MHAIKLLANYVLICITSILLCYLAIRCIQSYDIKPNQHLISYLNIDLEFPQIKLLSSSALNEKLVSDQDWEQDTLNGTIRSFRKKSLASSSAQNPYNGLRIFVGDNMNNNPYFLTHCQLFNLESKTVRLKLFNLGLTQQEGFRSCLALKHPDFIVTVQEDSTDTNRALTKGLLQELAIFLRLIV